MTDTEDDSEPMVTHCPKCGRQVAYEEGSAGCSYAFCLGCGWIEP